MQSKATSTSEVNAFKKKTPTLEPTVTSDSQGFRREVVDQVAHAGFSPFALWSRTFHRRSRWSTHIWAPSAGEAREAKPREASSHSTVLLILLILVCSQCRPLPRTSAFIPVTIGLFTHKHKQSHHFPAAVWKSLISVSRTKRRINSWEINKRFHVWLGSARRSMKGSTVGIHRPIVYILIYLIHSFIFNLICNSWIFTFFRMSLIYSF